MRSLTRFLVLGALLIMPFVIPAEARRVGGVVVPDSVEIAPAGTLKPDLSRFLGIWAGSWDGALRHILIVSKVEPDGKADVIYAIGDNRQLNIRAEFQRYPARIKGDTLLIESSFRSQYTFRPDGTTQADWSRGAYSASTAMKKVSLASFAAEPPSVPFPPSPQFGMLPTTLVENGKPVSLETVTFKPEGQGPFPVVIFNHGSIGMGTDPRAFYRTYFAAAFAHFMVERGYIVVFPQRRGRGKSEGIYDEGFEPDRSRYSCNPRYALPGAERALGDIDASVEAVRALPEAQKGPVLMGGQSRGGILAVAYAGMHPEKVSGVINFVGGWLGGLCPKMDEVNSALFNRGVKAKTPSLWLYGNDDDFYAISASRKWMSAFTGAGGKGEFLAYTVPGKRNGHALLSFPALWSEKVELYLKSLPPR